MGSGEPSEELAGYLMVRVQWKLYHRQYLNVNDSLVLFKHLASLPSQPAALPQRLFSCFLVKRSKNSTLDFINFVYISIEFPSQKPSNTAKQRCLHHHQYSKTQESQNVLRQVPPEQLFHNASSLFGFQTSYSS